MRDSGLGWAPEIPVGWSLIRAKYLLTKLDRVFKAEDTPLICTNKGKVIERGETNYGLVSSDEMNYQGVHPGDLLIHGMDTWHGAIAMSELGGKCTTVVHVCDSDQDKRFLCYYYQALAFQNVYKLISNGIRQNTSDFRSFSKFGEIPTFVPPLSEQQRIADYLDERCAAIDEVRKTITDEIEALRRLRKATIHRAVTKGLNEGAPMRDSGIPWVDEVPADWKVEHVQGCFKPEARKNDRVMRTVAMKFYDGTIVSKPLVELDDQNLRILAGYQYVDKDAIVINGLNLNYDLKSKRVGLVMNDGVITSAYMVINPQPNLVVPRYANYLFKGYDYRKAFHNMGVGIRKTLSWNEFKHVYIPLPPLAEQQRIADYLDERCAAIDSVIDTRTRQLERLDDYRRALIFAYVTGKKEVPTDE